MFFLAAQAILNPFPVPLTGSSGCILPSWVGKQPSIRPFPYPSPKMCFSQEKMDKEGKDGSSQLACT